MPVCGFDQQMLEGLRMFHNGLARAITRRTNEGTSFERAIHYELEEIDAFVNELPNLSDEINRERLIGIARYARAFYQGALINGFEKEDSVSRDFLYSVDRAFYDRFKGRKESMPDLIKFLNNGEK
ncbi:hypothetical protein HYT23_04980 [Candidatus Pacearchaeota archaeon]|nr:hypothetical protein [Candidatus Pacearchaeota archaeon]